MNPVKEVNEKDIAERQKTVNGIMSYVSLFMAHLSKNLPTVENLSESDNKQLEKAIRETDGERIKKLAKETQTVTFGTDKNVFEKYDANEKKAMKIADEKARSNNQTVKDKEREIE